MKKSSLFSDVVIYSIGSFLSKSIAFFLLPVYTRIFSPYEYGVLDILSVTISLLTIVISCQMEQGVARFFINAKSSRMKQSITTTGLLHLVCSFLFFSGLLIIFRDFFSGILLQSTQYSFLFLLAILYLMFNALTSFCQNQLKWQFDVVKYSISSILYVVITPILIVFFAIYCNLKLVGVYYAYICSNILISSLLLYWINEQIKISVISFKIWKKLFFFSYPLIFACIFGYCLQMLDRYFIAHFMSLKEVGVYGVAARVSSVIMIIFHGFQLAFGPYIFKHYKKESTKTLIRHVFNLILMVSGCLYMFICLFSKELISIVTTPLYYDSVKVIPLLISSVIIYQLSSQFSIGFGLARKTNYLPIISFFGVVINVVLNLWFIPILGIVGAALATFLSFVFVSIVSILWSQRYYYVDYDVWKIGLFLFILILITGVNYLQDVVLFVKIAYFLIVVLSAVFLYKKEVQLIIDKLAPIIKKR